TRLRKVSKLVFWVFSYIRNVDYCSRKNDAGRAAATPRGHRERSLNSLEPPRAHAVESRDVDELAVERKNSAAFGIAKLARIARDSLEDRLHVALRLADHAQDVARGGLLL